MSSTPAGVSGTLTVNAVSGVATFNGLVFNGTGTYTLSAASTGLAGVTSGLISIYASRATSQYIFGTQAGSAVPTNSSSFMGLSPRDEAGVWAADPSSSASYALMPTTGTLNSLCVNLTTAPGIGASWTWKLYKNGADQSLSVTISGAQTQACDAVDTTGFAPGDLVALHVTPGSSPAHASTYSSWYIVQTPVVPGETIMFGSHPVGGSYVLARGGNGSGFFVEKAMKTIIATAGTITKYIAEYVGTGSSVTAVLDQNESPTAVSVSLTSGAFAQQTASLSVSAGDVFDVSETGITASSPVYASMVLVPNVPGQFVIPSYRNGEVNSQATTYFGVTGRSPDNFQLNESQHADRHYLGGDGGYAVEHRNRSIEQHCRRHHRDQPQRLLADNRRQRLWCNAGRRLKLLDLHHVYTGFGYQLLGDAIGGRQCRRIAADSEPDWDRRRTRRAVAEWL
jgi:hypothetical protein